MVTPARRRLSVRLASAMAAALVVFLYCLWGRGRQGSLHTNIPSPSAQPNEHSLATYPHTSDRTHTYTQPRRHLLGYHGAGYYGNGSQGNESGCRDPLHPPLSYNGDSCQYVRDRCSGEVQLINYLSFIACDMRHLKPLAYILIGLWLVYLISLLATTAGYFFVPPLNLLADKLRLSPSIAGITLLAVGNGAPDVFTAYAALKLGQIELVLGALIGASIFISTVVLGTIILITKVENIDKIDFIRDVTAYILAVGLVVLVAIDGKVELYESILFPVFYILYIAAVVLINYIRSWVAKRRIKWTENKEVNETTPFLRGNINTENIEGTSIENEDVDKRSLGGELAEYMDNKEPEKHQLRLEGLTWPKGKHIGVKVQWVCEWPFSLLRWLSIPPCCQDGHWTKWHHWFAVASPAPMAMVLLIATKGWAGFSVLVGRLDIFILLILLGMLLSVLLFFLLSPERPPHWIMQALLGLAAFIMSIAWLNVEATETVAILEAFGLVFGIDTAILGLTVLAIGNSVGDWVADTAVSRAGHPEMGVASCFRSPLLNDVIGLSLALIAKIAIYQHGKPFPVPIHEHSFGKVKLSWIFLGISLLASAVIFPLFKFKPPKPYGVALIYFYLVFMVFGILDEVGVMKISLN